jgi:2-oxo-3-hexenedioate decarboxylase
MTDIAAMADLLHQSARRGQDIEPLTDSGPLDIETAYSIQNAVIEHRLADGERITGAKLGLTSRAKQAAMGVSEPLYGWLTDAMSQPLEAPLDLSPFIHPRAEPEIAFLLGRQLHGGGVSAADVMMATEAVAGAIEIIDSRYRDFRFTLPDAVADNASAAAYILGPLCAPGQTDLSLIGCALEVDGEVVDSAAGASLLGHPAESVASLANHLARSGRRLEAGWVVLAGGMTAPVPLAPGRHIAARYSRLGSARLACARTPDPS